MGYLIAAYVVTLVGVAGYWAWLVRERRSLQDRLVSSDPRSGREEAAPGDQAKAG